MKGFNSHVNFHVVNILASSFFLKAFSFSTTLKETMMIHNNFFKYFKINCHLFLKVLIYIEIRHTNTFYHPETATSHIFGKEHFREQTIQHHMLYHLYYPNSRYVLSCHNPTWGLLS